ncbi:MAG: deoxyribodipyrimidine photo-lyase/cryptochrome family protein, partial [Pseudomonadota bacterium]
KRDLQTIGLSLLELHSGIIQMLNHIAMFYRIGGLHSHEETGNDNSYQLDKAVASWCKAQNVNWHEYPQNGVVRRLKNRDIWTAVWERRMAAQTIPLPLQARMATLPLDGLQNNDISRTSHAQTDKPFRQKGGREEASKVLHTFLNGRGSPYRGGISSPLSSESAGSRLSPYLTWGVLSMREVVQSLRQKKLIIQANPSIYPKGLLAGLMGFESRLHWHCHFMQKLESEPAIEYENLHPAFKDIRDQTYASTELQARLIAWRTGQTGWPLVDACMAMLRETGWINFRMRAMLMSTASYLLWLHWRETGLHLAREFLDYEPGIHWSQVQMQSGTTGINTLRIYNPVKQAKDQDPEGIFVRRWLPALRNVSNTWIFQPWLMPESLQLEYGCRIGIDYPAPLVSIYQVFKLAKAQFSQLRMTQQNREQTAQIVKKHASRKSTSQTHTTKNGKVSRKKTANKSGSRQQSLF